MEPAGAGLLVAVGDRLTLHAKDRAVARLVAVYFR
jgi:hypothetical protein